MEKLLRVYNELHWVNSRFTGSPEFNPLLVDFKTLDKLNRDLNKAYEEEVSGRSRSSTERHFYDQLDYVFNELVRAHQNRSKERFENFKTGLMEISKNIEIFD